MRLPIRDRLQTETSIYTKYTCTSLALAFALQNDEYVVFVNWGTPASPFSGVFCRKEGRKCLALNQSIQHTVLTRYHPWEMWANWKSLTRQEASVRFTKIKCGPMANFQGYWSQALKLRNIWGLLGAPTEQSLAIHRCLSPVQNSSFIVTQLLLTILHLTGQTSLHFAGVCLLISPAINLNPASDAQYLLNFTLSPEPFPMPGFFDCTDFLQTKDSSWREGGSKHQLCW